MPEVMWVNSQPATRRRRVSDLTPAGLQTLEERRLLSGSISAEFVYVDNSAALTGYQTADLQVTTTSDWTGAALLLELTQGSIYQDPNGGNTPPPAGVFGIFPTLEFDTYVAANGNNVSFAGGGGDVGGNAFRFDSSELDLTWFDTATNDTGTINLGRITLSDNATGTWSLKLINAVGDVFLSLDTAFSNGELASPPPPPPPPPPGAAVDGDFTGDGKADIFWHSTTTGRNAVWEMDGIDFVGETAVRRLRNTNWKLVGTGDFTSDGKNDLLWHNTANGKNSVWEMDGTDFVSATAIKKLGNLDWQVAGVGDFTGDGNDDILWRNTKDGRNTAWEMNGTDFVSGVALKTLSNLKWQAAGVGDFTGDGNDDILWRNAANGRNSVWEFDGPDFVQASAVKRVKNLAWQVASIADYTGDGKADILWRHTQNGSNTVWEMDNLNFLGALALPAKTDLDDQPPGPILGLWEA